LSTTGFPTTGLITVDNEAISYTGLTGISFTGCIRGADSTTAASHTISASVQHTIVAAHHNLLKDEIIALEQNIVDRFGLNTNIVIPSGIGFRLAATLNQLVFGTTNTTTLSFTAPAASRVYTFPDVLGNSDVVLTAGVQTLTGLKTFSDDVKIAATKKLILSTDLNDYLVSDNDNEIRVFTNGLQRFTIGNPTIVAGHTSTTHAGSYLELNRSGQQVTVTCAAWSSAAALHAGGYFTTRSRSDTIGVYTETLNNDELGEFEYFGSDA